MSKAKQINEKRSKAKQRKAKQKQKQKQSKAKQNTANLGGNLSKKKKSIGELLELFFILLQVSFPFIFSGEPQGNRSGNF